MNQKIYAYARTHHGLVTREVALALGLSPQAWLRALRSGRLEALGERVARVPGAPRTREQRILAAVWSAGPQAVASHRSAAWLWGVERSEDDPIDVIVGRSARPVVIPGTVVHRPRDRGELEAVVRRGIPSTSAPRMIVDLGGVDPRGVYPAMEALVVARTMTPAGVVAVLSRHAGRGRRGAGPLRAALARYPLALDIADSALELMMAEVVRRYELPAVEFHPRVGGYEPDFRVVGTRVLLECEGRSVHGLTAAAFERDRRRAQDLVGAGSIIVPFTWTQLTREPAGVVRRLRKVLETWAPEVLVAAHAGNRRVVQPERNRKRAG